MKYKNLIDSTISLLQDVSNSLEIASKGKLSTNEVSPERLVWEYNNKIFSILVTLENSLRFKDSLTTHLICRFSYEMMIVFAYLILNKNERQNRLEQFLIFSQFKSDKRKWTNLTFTEMINKIPDNERFSFHSRHYRNLSNFAHPTMDAFLLNRRGEDSEYHMIIVSTVMSLISLLEIAKICREEKIFYTEDEFKTLKLEEFGFRAESIMKATGIKINPQNENE